MLYQTCLASRLSAETNYFIILVSIKESELKPIMLYEPDLAEVEQNVVNTEQSRHTLGSYFLHSTSSEQNIVSTSLFDMSLHSVEC